MSEHIINDLEMMAMQPFLLSLCQNTTVKAIRTEVYDDNIFIFEWTITKCRPESELCFLNSQYSSTAIINQPLLIQISVYTTALGYFLLLHTLREGIGRFCGGEQKTGNMIWRSDYESGWEEEEKQPFITSNNQHRNNWKNCIPIPMKKAYLYIQLTALSSLN